MALQRIIFIGGASVSGKTTLAKQVGKVTGLPWLSADYIHDIALAVGVREESPETFRIRDYTAEDFYSTHTIDQVVDSEITIGHETWRGVKALIKAGFEGVIEGVAVLPELVHSLASDSTLDISVVYLSNTNAESILKIANARGIWDAPHMYSDEVKNKEVDFVLKYDEFLETEAKKYNFTIVNTDRTDATVDEVCKILDI